MHPKHTLLHNSMTTTDYSTLNEEWLARYRDVTNSLEAVPDDDQHAASLHAAALAVRAGRQGALQCAQMENKEDLTIGQLLEHTQREMDQEAATSIQLKLVEKLASSRLEVVDVDNDDSLLSQQQQQDVDVDADAFFDEYPECIRSDWDTVSQQVESDDDDEDENDSPPKAAPAIKDRRLSPSPPSHGYVESNNAPPLGECTSASYKNQSTNPAVQNPIPRNPYQQQQQQQTPQSHAPPRNPYANPSREDTNNQFSYTPSSQPGRPPSAPPPGAFRPSSSSWDNHPSSAGFGTGSGGNSAPQHRNPPPPSVSNNHSSWEDHRNEQNPFQTAREFAQGGGGADEAKGGTNHLRRAQDKQQQQQQAPQQNSWQDQRVPNANPYRNPYSQQAPSNAEDANGGPPMAGGPGIPPSLTRKFQPPKRNENNKSAAGAPRKPGAAVSAASSAIGQRSSSGSGNANSNNEDDEELPEELQHLDKELVKKIQNEIMESGETITFDDIAGLDDAKQTVQEVVCWPMKRPDLFTGLRRAPNGLLLYGPPGTGKTLIGKAIAHESGATFFSISSSSLTSKWIGEGEKLVKTLFAVAAYREPAVVFIDEIDSLLTQRKASENEASRRIKTEFLVQLDGTGTSGQGRVLVIGATNRPQELDEAARRRFTKRLYIPLPSESDRGILLHVMLKKNNHRLTDEDVAKLAKNTDGFSGADIKSLCTDAAMGPIRQLGPRALEVEVKDVPPISFKHFRRSLKGMKPSVAASDLVQYMEWDQNYGSKRADEDDDSDEDM